MKYTSDATFGVSLKPTIAKPLDVRLVVDSVEELYQIPADIAYQGMPVIHAGSAEIYVLIDKSKITSAEGWKASYESIQIKYCTETEYNTWLANTDEGYKAIDSTLEYIRENVYYFIDEDSVTDKASYYVSSGQLAEVNNTLGLKANNSALILAVDRIDALEKALALYNIDKEEFVLNKMLGDYYDKVNIDNLLAEYDKSTDVDIKLQEYVKISDITGDGSDSNYIFVNKSAYDEDLKAIKDELANTIKSDSNGSLDSIAVNTIQDREKEHTLDMTLRTFDNKELALTEDIPVIEVLTETEYQEKVANNTVNAGTYYMTHGDEDNDTGYVDRNYLEKYYVTREDFNALLERVKALEPQDSTEDDIQE